MFSDRTNWQLAQNQFTQAVEDARARGGRLLDLSASNPTRVGLEYDALTILGALNSPESMNYDPQAKGLLSARQAVAAYYRDEHKIRDLHPDRIVLTTSTSEGYSYVFRLLCNAADEMLVPKPSYPLFEFLADLQDVKLIPYPLIYDHGWQMDFHSLAKVVSDRTRGIVVVHPNNPTGSYVKAKEQTQLNAFCRERELALVVDEVFLDFRLGDSQPASFAGNEAVLTFTLSGLSKVSALPQMKIAWTVTSGPAAAVKAAMGRMEVIADTYLSINAPIQWALPSLLEQRHGVQRQLKNRVNTNLAELDRQLTEQTLCQRLCVEGGWYAVLRVPVTRSDEDLAIQLVRDESVIVHPGHFYDFPTDGYLVLSLITPPEEFSVGVERVLASLAA